MEMIFSIFSLESIRFRNNYVTLSFSKTKTFNTMKSFLSLPFALSFNYTTLDTIVERLRPNNNGEREVNQISYPVALKTWL